MPTFDWLARDTRRCSGCGDLADPYDETCPMCGSPLVIERRGVLARFIDAIDGFLSRRRTR